MIPKLIYIEIINSYVIIKLLRIEQEDYYEICIDYRRGGRTCGRLR